MKDQLQTGPPRRMLPRYRFILRYGVLGYGGLMFLLFNMIHIVRLHLRGASMSGLPLWLLVNAVIWPLMGYGFGAWVWRRMQHRSVS